jgi:hypothetical protein
MRQDPWQLHRDPASRFNPWSTAPVVGVLELVAQSQSGLVAMRAAQQCWKCGSRPIPWVTLPVDVERGNVLPRSEPAAHIQQVA